AGFVRGRGDGEGESGEGQPSPRESWPDGVPPKSLPPITREVGDPTAPVEGSGRTRVPAPRISPSNRAAEELARARGEERAAVRPHMGTEADQPVLGDRSHTVGEQPLHRGLRSVELRGEVEGRCHPAEVVRVPTRRRG